MASPFSPRGKQQKPRPPWLFPFLGQVSLPVIPASRRSPTLSVAGHRVATLDRQVRVDLSLLPSPLNVSCVTSRRWVPELGAGEGRVISFLWWDRAEWISCVVCVLPASDLSWRACVFSLNSIAVNVMLLSVGGGGISAASVPAIWHVRSVVYLSYLYDWISGSSSCFWNCAMGCQWLARCRGIAATLRCQYVSLVYCITECESDVKYSFFSP